MSFIDEVKGIVPPYKTEEEKQDKHLTDMAQETANELKRIIKQRAASWQEKDSMSCSFLLSVSNVSRLRMTLLIEKGYNPKVEWLEHKTIFEKRKKLIGWTTIEKTFYSPSNCANLFFEKLSAALPKEDGFVINGWKLLSYREPNYGSNPQLSDGIELVFPDKIISEIDATLPFSLDGCFVEQNSSIFRLEDYNELLFALMVTFEL